MHEVLLTSVDLFELAPVPGLQAAARTLLEIWDSLQEVDVSFFIRFAFFFYRCYRTLNVDFRLCDECSPPSLTVSNVSGSRNAVPIFYFRFVKRFTRLESMYRMS